MNAKRLVIPIAAMVVAAPLLAPQAAFADDHRTLVYYGGDDCGHPHKGHRGPHKHRHPHGHHKKVVREVIYVEPRHPPRPHRGHEARPALILGNGLSLHFTTRW